MNYNESDGYAQTLFKRFWQMGYKGRFASFRWPTYGSGGVIGAVGTYNDSEYVAWYSGAPLAQYVQSMGCNYAVNIVAHSMGNIVSGAALADYGMQVSGYAMLHAASSASCYSQTNSSYPIISSNTNVPDTDGDFYTKSLGYTGHLAGITVGISGIVNYYDTNDFAITTAWYANNDYFKPNAIKGYGYYPNPAVLDPNNIWKIILTSASNYRQIVYKSEAMAFVDHSLTGAVGANAGLAGPIQSHQNESDRYGADHSYEFTHPISDWNVLQLFRSICVQFGVNNDN
jgi:hypothetical protein